MKRLLLLGLLALMPSTAAAQTPTIKCPGESTVEMRYCASNAREQSTAKLRKNVPTPLLKQWQEATRAVCAAAYSSYKEGTIYQQLAVECHDHLNRALLKEFIPMEAR